MMESKKAFSLIEMLFAIVLIAIISSVAISKISFGVNSAVIVKAKGDIALIRSSINMYKNRMLLSQKDQSLVNLDDAVVDKKDQPLFNYLINDVIFLSTNSEEKKQGQWIKVSNNSYEFIVSNEQSVVFNYDDQKSKFECNIDIELCQMLIQ